jgi:LPXTG-site transpeptidase (sortase) family protein
MTADGRLWLTWLSRGLIAGGAACLIWSGYRRLEPIFYAEAHRSAIRRLAVQAAPDAPVPPVDIQPIARGTFVGTVAIPRLGLDAVIAQGADDHTLSRAVGHLADTPFPWQTGNSALAGHRDALFRPLRRIRVGDEIRVSTLHGAFRYRVSRTLVVPPDAVWVVGPTRQRTLTLITCYPFVYVGHAPKRFIVRAVALEPAPAAGRPQAQRAAGVPGESVTGRPMLYRAPGADAPRRRPTRAGM